MTVRDLIDAIENGKSVEIEQAFETVMADKVSAAIDARREQISRNFLGANEETQAVEPDDEDEDSHGF